MKWQATAYKHERVIVEASFYAPDWYEAKDKFIDKVRDSVPDSLLPLDFIMYPESEEHDFFYEGVVRHVPEGKRSIFDD